MQQLNFAPVPFRGATLFLVEHRNEPYTPMKPIVEGMGLDWKSQHAKVSANPDRWGMVIITIPSGGGEQEMVCMPLRKLAGWLMTIHPNKVKPEIRDTIVAYQNECDEALWQYWSQGMAVKPGVTPPPQPQDRFLETLVKEFGKGNGAAAELLRSRYGLSLDIAAQRAGNARKKMSAKEQMAERCRMEAEEGEISQEDELRRRRKPH